MTAIGPHLLAAHKAGWVGPGHTIFEVQALVCHAWEGGHLYIGTGMGRTTTIEHTELRSDGIWEDSPMRANEQVHFSPKAVPLVESRTYPIIIESPYPEQHEGTIGWSAAAYMDTDIGGANATTSNKCTDIKGGGSGRIRHGREVRRTTVDGARRVGGTRLGPIEDNSPDRKGRIRVKISDMNAGPELVPGAIETYGTRGQIK